jgi:predicted DNA-binding transcriptional regulator YafY
MSKLPNQKLKLLYLLKILLEKTDSEHTLTVPEMIEELKKYNISAERKSIYDDIEALKTFGLDIVCRKSKTYDYYIAGRTFQLAELKLLADAVASSKFITEKKSGQLIKKIGSLTSIHEAKQLTRHVYVSGRGNVNIKNVVVLGDIVISAKNVKSVVLTDVKARNIIVESDTNPVKIVYNDNVTIGNSSLPAIVTVQK